MSNVAVVEPALVSPAGQSGTGGQPTAQQINRFEQQLQAPDATQLQYYQSPAGASADWRVVTNDLGRLSEEFRTEMDGLADSTGTFSDLSAEPTDLDPMDADPDPADLGHTVESFKEAMSKEVHMSFTMMHITWVATAEQEVGQSVRTLYKLE